MEWLTAIRKSIDYIENHLNDNISAQDVAEQVYVSPLHFQRGFLIMTGYSISEYIRNRKLYMAALELKKANRKVIDVDLIMDMTHRTALRKRLPDFMGFPLCR